jgi:adenylate cyclase
MPLGLRLAVLIALLMVLGMGVMSVAILVKQNEVRHAQIQDFGTALSMQLAVSVVEPLFTNDQVALDVMTANFVKLPRIKGAAIIDSSGQVIAESGYSRGDIAELPTYEGGLASILEAPPDIVGFSSPISFKGVRAGNARINIETSQHSRAYSSTLRTLLVTCAVVTLLAMVVAWFISRYVSRPISQILEAIANIGSGGEIQSNTVERRGDELGQLMSAINEMGHGLLQKNQVESLLSRFLAKDVADEMLSQLDTVNIGGARVEATVLFADIVGFTTMSEELSPEEVAEFLNEYYGYFTLCSRFFFGTVDKFIGDCAMVIFGAPKADTEHSFHAICCAVLIQKLMERLNQVRVADGKPGVMVRIGVNSGQMLAGVMGDSERMEYTVVGDSVNLASRLCGESSGGQVIIEDGLYQKLAPGGKIVASSYKSIRLRGKTMPSTIYTVEDVAEEYRMPMTSMIDEVMGKRSAA